MTAQLTQKEQWFVDLMARSSEQERRGFEILLQRDDFPKFFDALRAAGLFRPERNSGPVPGTEPGYVQIPYWSALDYLVACARAAGARVDPELSEKVLRVVREVSASRDASGRAPDNFHTWRKFAEVIGLLPTHLVTTADVDLVPVWLDSKFETALVTEALDTGAMTRFLASEDARDWPKACAIVKYCTQVRWIEETARPDAPKKPVTAADGYWLKALLERHAEKLGQMVGEQAAAMLAVRVREVFSPDPSATMSWLTRPAVEEDEQNHSWETAPNLVVSGLRDVLLSWVRAEPPAARQFVSEMLGDQCEMIRRIALFVVNERSEFVGELLPARLQPTLFVSGHRHELYNLLRDRFGSFEPDVRARTVEAIRGITVADDSEDAERRRKHIQLNWLSAIAGKGDTAANGWYAALKADPSIREIEHPDFLSYSESWWGPGPSPYAPQQLLALAEQGPLVETLNAFRESDSWRGPTESALVDALTEAVAASPMGFLRAVPSFTRAKRPFQYGIISGYQRAWTAATEDQRGTLSREMWPVLFDLCEAIVASSDLWSEQDGKRGDMTLNASWIPPLIADLLKSGTRDDSKAYPEEWLPRGWSLLRTMLIHVKGAQEADDDPVMQAFNTPRGRVLEALFSHALRTCRVADRRGGHDAEWAQMRPVFDEQLARTPDVEFAVLAGMYLAQLHYMDAGWVRANMPRLFPPDERRFAHAIAGLKHATANRPIYALLLEAGVADRALRSQLTGRQTRERLLERISLSYLWGDEQLDGSRFGYLLRTEGGLEDLQHIASFLWSIRRDELSPEQVERVIAFWERCVDSGADKSGVARLLSGLSLLASYVNVIDARALRLLLAVAPFAHLDHHGTQFIEQLDRLAGVSAEQVAEVLRAHLQRHTPPYDFHGHLASALRKVAQQGHKLTALDLIEKVRDLDGMRDLYRDISGTAAPS